MTTKHFDAALGALESDNLYEGAAHYLRRSGYAQYLAEVYHDMNDDVMESYYDVMARLYDWQAFISALESAASEREEPPKALRRYATLVGCGGPWFDVMNIRSWIGENYISDMCTYKDKEGNTVAWFDIGDVSVLRDKKNKVYVNVGDRDPIRVPPCDVEVLERLLDYVEAEY